MLSSIFSKSLWEQRRSLLWWSIGLAAIVVVTMLFYPSFKDSPEFNQLFDSDNPLLRAFIGGIEDFTSPEGFVNSQLFVFLLPMLYLAFAIMMGSGAIASEEERGTMDVLLSNPVTRTQVVLHKFAAMLVAILILTVVVWASMAIGAMLVSMEISYLRMAEATISGAFLGMVYGGLAFAVSCARGRRSLSVGVSAALGVGAYLLNALGPLANWLEPFIRVSPFYYYGSADPLSNGLNILHALVLIGLVAVFVGVGVVTFERRDLGVG